MAISVRDARMALERWSFLPGWVFHLIEVGANQAPLLRVQLPTPDCEEPDRVITIGRTITVDLENMESVDELAGPVEQLTRETLVHELHEWLRVDGRKVFDPHWGGWVGEAARTVRVIPQFSIEEDPDVLVVERTNG